MDIDKLRQIVTAISYDASHAQNTLSHNIFSERVNTLRDAVEEIESLRLFRWRTEENQLCATCCHGKDMLADCDDCRNAWEKIGQPRGNI